MMRAVLLSLAALSAAVVGHAAVHHPTAHARAAAIDWTRTVSATPQGGFRMGNPNAKVAIVEYASFTCPHCAAFAREGLPALRDSYVRTGKVSVEMRVALRDRIDYVAGLLARCAGPARYFPTAEAVFAGQNDWETKAIDFDSAHPSNFEDAGGTAAMTALANGSGLGLIAGAHGIAPPVLSRCFSDLKARAALKASTDEAWNVRKIGGTPAFLLNGTLIDDVHEWTALKAKIDTALKG